MWSFHTWFIYSPIDEYLGSFKLFFIFIFLLWWIVIVIMFLFTFPFIHVQVSFKYTLTVKLLSYMIQCVCVSCSVMFNPLRPYGLQPTRLTRLRIPWNSAGKNTGVGCHFLLHRIFPTQELNLGLLHYRQFFSIWACREAVYMKLIEFCKSIMLQ